MLRRAGSGTVPSALQARRFSQSLERVSKPRRNSDANGVLLVNKPEGPTSFDIVAQARRIYCTRSVGHAGTLDPMATGVLVVLIGEATKLCNYLTTVSKRYRATIYFGLSTDSCDRTGTAADKVQLSSDWLSQANLEQALEKERNRTQQVPPAYSAIKVKGRRSYALARAGKSVPLEPRAVLVHELKLLGVTAQTAEVELHVSKGYYVRSFARDLGQWLGVPSHLSQLERVSSGKFEITECHSWPPQNDATPALISVADAASVALPTAILTCEGEQRARHGKRLDAAAFKSRPETTGVFAWLNADRNLVALGHLDGETYRVLRGFRQEVQSTSTSTS